jgi:hypothetical protein
MDTGGVRAWPRLTRAQLEHVFPDGKTLHIPVDGTPLSNSGYAYAQAQWKVCHMVPCSPDGSVPAPNPTDEIRIAALDPADHQVPTISIEAPTPVLFPVQADAAADATGPANPDVVVPFSKTPAMMVATADDQTALGAISSVETPALPPHALMPRTDMLTAYAPDIAPDPGAQQALRMIIARETTATAAGNGAAALTPQLDTAGLRLSLGGGTNGLTAVKGIFDLTWNAVTQVNGESAIASTIANPTIDRDPIVGLRQRHVELVAPEIDHVNETLATPLPMTDIHYADMTEPEGYLDNSAELGPYAGRLVLQSDFAAPPRYDRFIIHQPLLVATNLPG